MVPMVMYIVDYHFLLPVVGFIGVVANWSSGYGFPFGCHGSCECGGCGMSCVLMWFL